MPILILRVISNAALLFAFLQIIKIIRIKKSQVKAGWLFIVVLAYLLVEIGNHYFNLSETNQILVFSLFAFPIWINLIKFTLGGIQKGEKTWFNRVEHFTGGLLLFIAFHLFNVIDVFPIIVVSRWFEAFLYFLLANLFSILIEMLELLVDERLGRSYMIGPKITDTNYDVTMTFLGALVGMIGFIFLV